MTAGRHRGFTLAEVLIVVALLALLLKLTLPAYRSQLARVQRTAAQAQLLVLASQLERWHATHDGYGGYAIPPAQGLVPVGSTAPAYRISLSLPASGGFVLRATPVDGGATAGDGFLELTQSGERSWDADDSGTIDRDPEHGWTAR